MTHNRGFSQARAPWSNQRTVWKRNIVVALWLHN